MRPAVWIATLAVVLFAAGLLYLDSASFADRVRRAAERRLTVALDREVTIGGLELDLVPLTVTVSELRIAGPDSAGPPFLGVARAVVEAEPGALLARRIDLQHVELLEPRLRIGFDADGRADVPRFGAGKGGPARPVEARLGTLEIRRGELILDDDRTPLDLAARNLEAVFTGIGDGIELRGRAETDELGLVLPPGRPYDGRLEVHGVVRPHRFDVIRAEVSGPDLTASADGYWRWQGDRELALALEAAGDLAVLGRLGYLQDQLSGPFDFAGELTRKPGVWLVGGDVSSPRAVAFDRLLTGLEARVDADTNALAVRIGRGRHAGGDVEGSIGLGFADRPGRVDLELRLDRVGLDPLLADLGIPLRGLSGGVSGVFNYQFDSAAPEAGNGWADLVVADERAPAGGVPVSGIIPLTIGGGVVRSQALRLAAADFRLTGGGDFDLATAAGVWQLEVEADEMAQLMSLVPGGDGEAGPATAWRPTAGRGRASGRLDLTGAGAALRLVLDLAAIEAPGLSADAVGGLVVVDGAGVRELRLEATRADAAMIVSGAVPFAEAAPESDPFPFRLALDVAAWPLGEARVWLPFELPVAGPYTGLVELASEPPSPAGGEEEGLLGRLAGRLSPVRWGELEAESLFVEADFDATRLTVVEAELALAAGVVTGRGDLTWEDGRLDLAFDSTPLALASLAGTPVAAFDALAARLEATLSGRLETPDLRARLAWGSLAEESRETASGAPGAEPAAAAGFVASGEAIELEWRDGRLDVDGVLPGVAAVAGGGALEPERVDLDLALSAGRIDRLAAAAAPAAGIGGEFSGRVHVGGRYEPALEIEAMVTLERLTARLAAPADESGLPTLRNLEPVVLRVDGDGLELRSLYLGDDRGGSEVFVGGRVATDGGLDLQLQTAVASGWLDVLVGRIWPGARWSSGSLDAIATVGGDLGLPRLNGVGEVRGGRLVADGLPSAVEDLEATFLFYRDQMVVDSAGARVAGGAVRAGGSVPIGAEGAGPFRFQAVGEGLNYRSPDGWTARGDGEVVVASSPDGIQLSGGIVLAEVLYVKDLKLGLEQLLEGLFSAQRLEVAPAEGWRAVTQLNLRIEGDRTLRVRNNLADLRASADLVLRGTVARPVIFGSVEVEPGGRLEYAGADYRVERGQLTFTNPYRIEPAIDLSASTELREYDITLNLTGTPDRLELDFASNPPLADLDVFGLLAGSAPPPSSAVDGGRRSGDEGVGAESFLYGQATSLIAQRFNRLFGLDKFRIDPLTSSTGNLSSARVTIGKRLSRDLSVTYSYDPSATEEQILELDWNVSRSLVLVLTQNGDGTYAVDALWEKAF